jgi:hypothetical protein
MYVSRKVRATVLQRLGDHGGTLTVDNHGPAQRAIWESSMPWWCSGIFGCRRKIGIS